MTRSTDRILELSGALELSLPNTLDPQQLSTLFLSTRPWTTAQHYELLAELLKDESTRLYFQQTTEIIDAILHDIQSNYTQNKVNEEKEEINAQLVRSLANLCADNAVLSEKLLENNDLAIPWILQLLAYCADSKNKSQRLCQFVLALILNIFISVSSENDESTVPIHFERTPELVSHIARNINDADSELLEIIGNFFEVFIDIVGRDAIEACKIAGLVSILVGKLERSVSIACAEFLEKLLESHDGFSVEFTKDSIGNLKSIIKLVDSNQQNVEICDKLMKIIYLVASNDLFSADEYNNQKMDLISDFKKWLETLKGDALMFSVISIGNFARNDTVCLKIVQETDIVELLIGLMPPADCSTNIKHACLGAFRNFSVPIDNRNILVHKGVMEVTLNILMNDPVFEPVQAIALTILRNLSGSFENTQRIVKASNMQVFGLAEKISEESSIEAIKCESARLLCTLVRNSVDQNDSALNYGKFWSTIKSVMLRSNHVILKQEAIISLLALLMKSKSVSDIISNFAQDFIEEIMILLDSFELEKHMYLVSNCLSILKLLKEQLSEAQLANLEKKVFPLLERVDANDILITSESDRDILDSVKAGLQYLTK